MQNTEQGWQHFSFVARAARWAGAFALIGYTTMALAGVPPSITTQPQPQTVTPGSAATFSVVADGDQPLFYRWLRNGSFLPGSTNSPSATVMNVQTSATISVFISNNFGFTTSAPVSLTVTSSPAAPLFAQQPTNVIASIGSIVTFRATASGSPLPTYRWYFEGVPLGSNSTVLAIANVSTANVGNYFCIASNALGMATSQVATLTVVTNPPVFTLQPTNVIVAYNGVAIFRVAASGSPVPVYRWYRDGTLIAGSGTMLTVSNATEANVGSYFCIASNGSGMATSQVATLTIVTNPPVFTAQPTNRMVTYGGTAQFVVFASGTGPISYYWFHDGTAVGTNGRILGIFNTTFADAGNYWCIASNSAGMSTSTVATLTVNAAAPIFTTHPSDKTVYAGGYVQFFANASGIPTPALRWYHNGAPFTSNSGPAVYIGNITSAEAGAYVCVASNALGMATSIVATVTVLSVPPILSGPADISTYTGATVNWTVGLSNPPASLQLVLGGTTIVASASAPGYSANLVLPNVQSNDAGNYLVWASNQFGMSTSRVATLTVLPFTELLTNVVIQIPAFDAGNYDRNGEHDSTDVSPLAGSTSILDGRGPRRCWFTFNIPTLPGTLTQAVFRSYLYSSAQGAPQQFEFREITTPIETLRRGGFGLTNIYEDLADGPLFFSLSLTSQFSSTLETPLMAEALSAINSAQGADFGMGGSISDLNFNSPSDDYVYSYFAPPWSPILELHVIAPAAPTIFAQPPYDTAASFSNACTLNVGACGAEPMFYYWFVDGALTYLSQSPQFCPWNNSEVSQSAYVIVSNAFGTATSAVVQVKPSGQDMHPNFTNRFARVGDNVVFNVQSTFYAPSIQWYKNGLPIAQNAIYWTLLDAKLSDAGDYHVVFSGGVYGSITSAVMHLDVIETPPIIWTHPASAIVTSGDGFYQQAQVVGGPSPVIRWFHNGVLMPQATNQWLNFSPIGTPDAGTYFLTASNYLGVATSSVATITVLANAPMIWSGPGDQTVYAGNFASLYVNASGGGPLSYRWYHNGNPLPNALNNWSLNLTNVQQTSAGSYFCVVSNYDGAVTSRVATLTVLSVPPVVNGPNNVTVQLGGGSLNWYFSIANPPAYVQWFRESGELVYSQYASSGSSYRHFNDVQTNDAGRYYLVASNQFGISTSRLATLTVTSSPPVFSVQPSSETVVEGSTVYVKFDVSAIPWAQAYLYQNGVLRSAFSGYNYTPTGNFRAFGLTHTTLADRGDYFIVASNIVGMATSAVAQITIQRAGPLDKWTIRNPVPQGRDLHAIIWAQNKFVAVGDNGVIVTSPNGSNWMVRNTQTSKRLNGIAYGNNRFVATTWDNSVLTSADGENWDISLLKSNVVLEGVGFGNGNFFAVGYNYTSGAYAAQAFQSANGVDWALVPSLSYASNDFVRAIYAQGRWLVMESRGRPNTSTDLNNWTRGDSGLVPYVHGAAYANGYFFLLGDSGVMNVSEDGINWSGAFYNGAVSRSLYGITYGAGRYIVVASKGNIISSSGDPSIWRAVASPTTGRLEDVVFANDRFVAVGESGTIMVSTDGLNWFNQTRGPNHDLDGLAVANGLAVAVGKNGTILSSTDGSSWTQAEAAALDVGLHGVAFGQNKWVAVGDSTNIFVSTNGLDWEAQSLDFEFNYLKSVHYANGLWVAAGVYGEILTSPDALTWTRRTSPVTFDLNEVTFGQGMFLIVGDHGSSPNATVLTSPDGVTWTDRTYYTGKNARGVTYANGVFAMVNNDGLVLYSTNVIPSSYLDTNRWSYSATGLDFQDGKNLRGITWNDGLWVAIGNNGTILTATNIVSPPGARSWRQRLSPTFENLHAVRFFNNTFIAIGNEGIVVQSGPLVPQLSASCESNILCITLTSPYEGVYKLQETENFTAWQDAGWLTNIVGSVEQRLPMPSGNSSKKFYRAVSP
jgi:hypothetical protein